MLVSTMKAIDEPFGTMESTQEFLSLLSEKIDEVLGDARQELSACAARKRPQHVRAWQLVLYTTTKLSSHIANSRKLMGDLEKLRQLLNRNTVVADVEASNLPADVYPADRTAPMPEDRGVQV